MKLFLFILVMVDETFCPLSYSDLELKPEGVLEVKLVQARGLTNKDLIGKSDPFAVVYIRPLPDRMKRSKTIVSCHITLHFLCFLNCLRSTVFFYHYYAEQ